MSILIALSCIAIDGDTLHCRVPQGTGSRTISVRLLGIDAPEMPGHCRSGRRCMPGDPHAAKDSLNRAVYRRTVTLEITGVDHYGRALARAATRYGDLSCHQLRAGAAFYIPRWDQARGVARLCPNLARAPSYDFGSRDDN